MDARRVKQKETPTRSRRVQPSYLFMMHCLLYSRVQTGLLSRTDPYNEDVNLYLAQLLSSFINPEYVEQAKKSLSKYDTEVFRRLSTSADARVKYTIYKTNTDFLLVSIGIFDNPSAILSKSKAKGQPLEEASIGRGKAYYHFAYSFSQQVDRKNPAISDVLEKLSVGFDRYARILSHLRGEYVDIMKRLYRGEVYHLERTVDAEGKKDLLKQKQNLLLDIYSEWKKTGAQHLQRRLNQVVEEIRTLDPSFNFTITDESS